MEKLTRIAIVNPDKCKPQNCNQECKKSCPVVKCGKMCIEVKMNSEKKSQAVIHENLCIGCNQCVKKCPMNAITIINIPKELEKETIHRYGNNMFKLHRLPQPRLGQVLGLLAENGMGKSTAVKLLSGKIIPNFGNVGVGAGVGADADADAVIKYYRGNDLQKYFTNVYQNENFKCIIKPQFVNQVSRVIKGRVGDIIKSKIETDSGDSSNETSKEAIFEKIVLDLDLTHILNREIEELSGGELQRFCIAVVAVQKANVYMFDEPSSFLDIYQRIQAGKLIRGLVTPDNYVICIEHDLALLDYLSDFICMLYGEKGVYGVVSAPFPVRDGINIFLSGYLPTENLRFRETELTFKIPQIIGIEDKKKKMQYTFPKMSRKLQDFTLHVEEGGFSESEIIVLLGRNGMGKTTFIRLLAGLAEPDIDPDTNEKPFIPKLSVSYKPQKIDPTFNGTVRELFYKKLGTAWLEAQFTTDIIKPLNITDLLENQVTTLSGGEIQLVALTLCLGLSADMYLVDEPSAFLDSAQRLNVSKILKRFVMNTKKVLFLVEHDIMMVTYLADRVILYSGTPAVECTAQSPTTLEKGMNQFLQDLDVTFRRDQDNYRPRLNKMNSVKDQEQKKAGNYFYSN